MLDKFSATLGASTRTSAEKNIDDNKMWIASQKFTDLVAFVDAEVKRSEEVENQLRLPRTSIPTHYSLELDARNVHLGLLGFSGHVIIDVRITQTTDYIMMHSKTQAISELHVNTRAGADIPLLEYSLYQPTDTLTIYFMDELPVGTEIIVHVKYTTVMPTSGTGFYQTSYVKPNNVRTYLGTTQFQPTGARYCFPHYDEPEYKAVFDLKIIHDASYSAIANTYGADVVK